MVAEALHRKSPFGFFHLLGSAVFLGGVACYMIMRKKDHFDTSADAPAETSAIMKAPEESADL